VHALESHGSAANGGYLSASRRVKSGPGRARVGVDVEQRAALKVVLVDKDQPPLTRARTS